VLRRKVFQNKELGPIRPVCGADFSKSIFDGSFADVLALASGGGHTLRCHDPGAIVAWHRDGVSDGGHGGDV